MFDWKIWRVTKEVKRSQMALLSQIVLYVTNCYSRPILFFCGYLLKIVVTFCNMITNMVDYDRTTL